MQCPEGVPACRELSPRLLLSRGTQERKCPGLQRRVVKGCALGGSCETPGAPTSCKSSPDGDAGAVEQERESPGTAATEGGEDCRLRRKTKQHPGGRTNAPSAPASLERPSPGPPPGSTLEGEPMSLGGQGHVPARRLPPRRTFFRGGARLRQAFSGGLSLWRFSKPGFPRFFSHVQVPKAEAPAVGHRPLPPPLEDPAGFVVSSPPGKCCRCG